MIDVSFTIAKVKVYSKKYKTSNGKQKETKTKTINLGSNAPFNDNESVFIINQNQYDEIMNDNDHNKEIDRLNDEIKEFQRKFKELDNKYQEQFKEIQETKNDNKKLRDKLFESEDIKEELHDALHEAQGKINQKDIIITAYKTMGFWKRIWKYNPEKDIEIKQLLDNKK